jgi:porin
MTVANLAPGLLTFFNNGPVFGIPGTVTGDI